MCGGVVKFNPYGKRGGGIFSDGGRGHKKMRVSFNAGHLSLSHTEGGA